MRGRLRLRASVPVPAAAGAGGPAGSRCRGAGDGDLVPHTAVEVQAVALRLARYAVGDVGVERMPVIGRLCRAVGPLDGAELAGDARTGGGRPLHWRPVRGA